MLQKAAKTNPAPESSKKCPQCGLRNFANRNRCKRCKSDLSLALNVTRDDNDIPDSDELGRSTFSIAWILAALVVVLLGLVVFYMRHGSQGTTEVGSEAAVVETPVASDQKQPGTNVVETNSQSEAAATQIIAELKRFQDATERGMEYSEYDKQLSSLKTDLDSTLPSFVRHDSSDESFRQEVAAALRDYTAAQNWWKTTTRNSSVLTEADRNERTQRNFESARTHITNAEKTLVR